MKNVKSGHSVPIVCLDAGHYGDRNQGVVSGYYEARAMWTLTNYLGTALEAYGIKVIKTRQVQALDLDLVTRGRKAQGADLFISMHSNACDTERVDRAEAIYLVDDDCGKIDEQSKEIAGLLAETVREVMGTADKSRIFSRKSGNDRDRDGKINDDYYGVLYGAHHVSTAAIILEHSFHTNRRACEWLLNDANLRTMAKAEAKTIAAWFDVEKPASNSTPAPAPAPEPVKVDPAKSRSVDKRGTYKVKAPSGLRLRAGASTSKAILATLKDGAVVTCYGYHTGNWLYVQTRDGKVGYCYSDYLVKV